MKRFPPIFYYVSLANLLFFLGDALFVLFPVFLKNNLGAAESYIGFLNNIDKVIMIISAIVLGSLIHGKDRIRILRFGYILLFAVFMSYHLISTLSWYIIIIRIFHGIGFSICVILSSTIVFDSIPSERSTEAIGIFGITGAVSLAISPFVGEWLIKTMGYSHYILFTISAVLIVLSIITTLIMSGLFRVDNSSSLTDKINTIQLLRNSQFLSFIVITFIFGGAFGIIITFLANFIHATTNLKFSYFYVMYFFSLVILRFIFFKYITEKNRNFILLVALVLCIIVNLLMNIMDSIALLILAGIIYGIAHGVLYPVLNAVIVGIVPNADNGKSTSLFSASFNSGMVFFSVSFGLLIHYFNTYLVAFNGIAIALVISLFIIADIIRKRRVVEI
ncbi:MFS transporter [Spirochaetota bacterium]